MRYLEVADGLRERLARGDVAAGGALPSEAELSAETGASRVTVRRALEQLRAEGLVTSRRGSGWFAAHDPVRQSLGRVTTVEAALEAAGAHLNGVSSIRVRACTVVRGEPLELETASGGGDEVLRVQRLNLADGEPFALVTVWVPGELGHYLSRARGGGGHVLRPAAAARGRTGRATQQVGADIANAADAAISTSRKGRRCSPCAAPRTTPTAVPSSFRCTVTPQPAPRSRSSCPR